MRLWHKYLIPYLPRQQLVSQWRECCCIARNIYRNGAPNHILVNKILNYDNTHFDEYTKFVIYEMNARGYRINEDNYWKWRTEIRRITSDSFPSANRLFRNWHNKRYLDQCMYNLQEKFDCGGLTDEEWQILLNGYFTITGERFNRPRDRI